MRWATARSSGRVSRLLVRRKSRGSLIVVSVRRARSSLKYCLRWECSYSTCRLGGHAAGDHPRLAAKRRRWCIALEPRRKTAG